MMLFYDAVLYAHLLSLVIKSVTIQCVEEQEANGISEFLLYILS